MQQIDGLKERLVAFARLVEEMIEKARRALAGRDGDLCAGIIQVDEPRANELEVDLEEECTSLIARHQPMARDLRTILMVLRMTHDLERMADHAVNIAEVAIDRIESAPLPPDASLMRMFDETIGMVGDGIRAFVGEDAALGQRVCENDSVVDALATEILDRTSATMGGIPTRIAESLMSLKIAGNLERIADLSTNIGEDVVYMAEGRVIKHHRQDA